jgi:hypothetical protein
MDSITYQDEIGWDNFFSGFIHLGWAEHQQRFYEGRKSLRNGQQWMNHLLRHNWETAWDLWENRNYIKHQYSTQFSTQDIKKIDHSITQLYLHLANSLTQEDAYLCKTPLKALLKKHIHYKQEWLQQAKEVHNQQRDGSNRPHTSRSSWHTMIQQMRRTLHQWLNPN